MFIYISQPVRTLTLFKLSSRATSAPSPANRMKRQCTHDKLHVNITGIPTSSRPAPRRHLPRPTTQTSPLPRPNHASHHMSIIMDRQHQRRTRPDQQPQPGRQRRQRRRPSADSRPARAAAPRPEHPG